ncbi:MAG: methionyl-tRNA formyltransferase [Candidatus Walczuchella monophlebidarum]
MKKYPKIVFMGSSSFSVVSLEEILRQKYNVIGVVTAPDHPSGRKQKKEKFSVKECAIKNHLALLQPKNLQNTDFLEVFRSWKADIIVVVSYRKIPKCIWELPPLGSFNLHASLLPNYRGAAPIQWVIMNGEKETGVSTLLLNDKIDTGELLLQRKTFIGPKETAGDLYQRLANIGANAVIDTIQGIIENKIKPKPQSINGTIKKAPKLFHRDGKINWKDSIETIYNKIRGLSPFLGAWTQLMDNSGQKCKLKIYYANCIREKHDITVGNIIIDNKYLKVSLKEGYISIVEAQIEGKRRIPVKDIINGMQGKNYTIIY